MGANLRQTFYISLHFFAYLLHYFAILICAHYSFALFCLRLALFCRTSIQEPNRRILIVYSIRMRQILYNLCNIYYTIAFAVRSISIII